LPFWAALIGVPSSFAAANSKPHIHKYSNQKAQKKYYDSKTPILEHQLEDARSNWKMVQISGLIPISEIVPPNKYAQCNTEKS
jgi:hypothetical protein